MSISEIASTTISKVKRPVGRSRAIGTLTLLLGAFTTFIFGLGSNPASKSILTFNPTNLTGVIPPHVGELSVPSKATCLILGILIIAVGIEILVRRPAEGLMVRFGGSAVLFVIGLLIWTVRVPGPAPFGVINMTAVLVGSSPLVMVLVFGALSGVMCERAGVVNIAIEGQFIGGAFFGSMIASTTHNFILAAFMGALIGALLGLLLSFLALRYLSDQIIVGVVIVTMLASLSSYLNVQVLSPYPQYTTGDLAP
jgi:simple sugar transport system permease protein